MKKQYIIKRLKAICFLTTLSAMFPMGIFSQAFTSTETYTIDPTQAASSNNFQNFQAFFTALQSRNVEPNLR
jgi:hypothetical protein